MYKLIDLQSTHLGYKQSLYRQYGIYAVISPGIVDFGSDFNLQAGAIDILENFFALITRNTWEDFWVILRVKPDHTLNPAQPCNSSKVDGRLGRSAKTLDLSSQVSPCTQSIILDV